MIQTGPSDLASASSSFATCAADAATTATWLNRDVSTAEYINQQYSTASGQMRSEKEKTATKQDHCITCLMLLLASQKFALLDANAWPSQSLQMILSNCWVILGPIVCPDEPAFG